MRMFQNRRGNLDRLVPTALTIIVTIIVLVIMIQVNSNFQSQQSQTTATVANETITFVNNTATGLAQNNLIGGSMVVYGGNGTSVLNPQIKILNVGRNYTVDYNGGSITFLNQTPDDWFGRSTLNVSYQYYFGSYSYNISRYGVSGLSTLNSYMPTVVLVLVAAIIVGIIFSYLIVKKRNE